MKKIIYIALFCILAFFQLGILTFTLYKGVKEGNTLKFKCSLYDPYDPIKGRYLNLSFESQTQPLYLFSEYKPYEATTTEKYNNQDVYIVFYDNKNTSTPSLIKTEKPGKEEIFMKAKINFIDLTAQTINLTFPFSRYYIQENFAKEAEKILGDSENTNILNPTLVISTDENGNTRIVKLLVKNIPIEDYITKGTN